MNTNYILGTASNKPLALTNEERRRHIYLAGKTGTGKSTMLANLMRADLEDGRGFALIDPHGDLAQLVTDSTPIGRTRDVLYLDPLDATHAVSFNPLERVAENKRSLVTSSIVSAFKSIWAESWGPRMEYILGNSIRLLLDVPSATLLHLPVLLTDNSYRTRAIRHCTDPFTRYYWRKEFDGYSERFRQEAIAPIQNKVGQFASNPMLRAILGQRSSTIDIDDIMASRKILVANLSKQMGTEPAHLLGALLATAFSQAAERRATIPESEREDFTLYVDEFQNFATESFSTILSEARKWRLNLVLANQFLGQIPESLRRAVLGNVGTLVAFRVGSEDAPVLSAELDLAPNKLLDAANFTAWVKLVRRNVPTEAIYLKTLPFHGKAGSLPAVVKHTRARYSRSRPAVEKAVSAIFTSPIRWG